MLEEEAVEEPVAELGDEPGEKEPDRDLLVEHLPVTTEVVSHVGPCADRRQLLSQGHLLAGHVVLMTGVGRRGMLARLLLDPARNEDPEDEGHDHDHDQAADVLRDRELPADQHPEHEPELPDEVRGGELERERADPGGALLKQRLGDRDRRIGARRGCGAEARGDRHRPHAVARHGVLDPLDAGPSSARSLRSRSRSPAPTTPDRPSGTSHAARARSRPARRSCLTRSVMLHS